MKQVSHVVLVVDGLKVDGLGLVLELELWLGSECFRYDGGFTFTATGIGVLFSVHFILYVCKLYYIKNK